MQETDTQEAGPRHHHSPWPREAEFLLGCARLELAPPHSERLRQLLDTGLDWDRLYQLAARHGLQALLFRHLSAMAAGMPPRVEENLWSYCQRQRLRNERLEHELAQLLDLLEGEGTPVVPHKGPVLARRLYGDVALRAFSDLDLLLPVDQVPRIKGVLAGRGFAPLYPLTPALEAAFLDSPIHYHWMLRHQGNGLLVELHWRTDSEFAVEPQGDAAWWRQLPNQAWRGRQVSCLSDSELLLGLCLHGSKHHWQSLHWLVDVAELVRQSSSLDWPWILARTAALRAGRRLALALQLLEGALGTRLPDEVRAWAEREPAATRLRDRVLATWFGARTEPRGALARLQFNLRLYSTSGQRLRHLANMTLRPSLVEWSLWPLPRAAFFLYPPLRLGRLLAKRLIGKG